MKSGKNVVKSVAGMGQRPYAKGGILILIAGFILLIFLGGCQLQNLLVPGSDSDSNTPNGQDSSDGPVSPVNLDTNAVENAKQTATIEYCKNELKIKELLVKSTQKKVDKEQNDLMKRQGELQLAQSLNDADDIAEKQNLIQYAEQALQEAKDNHELAKANLNDIAEKCTSLSQRKDKKVCDEFTDILTKNIDDTKASLAGNEQDIVDVKKMLEDAKTQGKSSAFLQSIEDELDEENLEVLKDKNKIDKFTKFLEEVKGVCA